MFLSFFCNVNCCCQFKGDFHHDICNSLVCCSISVPLSFSLSGLYGAHFMMGSSVLNMKRSHSNVQIRITQFSRLKYLGGFLGCNLTIAPAPMDTTCSHLGRKALANKGSSGISVPHPTPIYFLSKTIMIAVHT